MFIKLEEMLMLIVSLHSVCCALATGAAETATHTRTTIGHDVNACAAHV